MKKFIFCFCILFYCIGVLSAQSDSTILALEDTLRTQTDSMDIAKTLYDMGRRYYRLGEYDIALKRCEKALKIRIDSLGEEHLDVAEIYHSLGTAYLVLKKYTQASRAYKKALDIKIDSLGDKHSRLSNSYNNLSVLHRQLGDYEEALKTNKKALDIRLKNYGDSPCLVADTYSNLAIIHDEMANYEEALKINKKALDIRIKNCGDNQLNVAKSYNNISIIYTKLGNYEKALNTIKKALDIKEDLLGENHPSLANSYTNIASLYEKLGNYPKALNLNEKALKIRVDSIGENSVDAAMSYYKKAKIYHVLGKNTESLELVKKSLKIRTEHLGEEYFEVGSCYSLISNIYRKLKNYEEAIKFNEKASEIWINTSDEHHYLSYAHSHLGIIYNKLGEHQKALKFNEKALKIQIDKLGKNHPDVATSYRSIANTYQALNKHKTADSIWHIVINQSLKRLNDTYLFLPDNQRLEYAKTFKEVYSNFYSFTAKHGSEDTKKLAAYLLLNTKSLALDYSISARELINNIDNKELKTLHNELKAINENISQAEPMTDEKRKENNWDITTMRDQQEDLTRQLLKNKTLKEKLYKKPITWENTQDQLKSDEVLLDFVRFYEESDSTWMYYAMLARRNMSAPAFIRLTEQKAITSLLKANERTGQPNYIQNDKGLQALYQKIWQPLIPYLEDVKTVHLSPSGLLHRINFEALQDENEKYLTEYFKFHYYNTMRDFTRKEKTNFLSKIFKRIKYKMVLFGDIDYGSTDAIASTDTLRDGITPLPETGEEIKEIGKTNENKGGTSIYITGSAATEKTLKHHTGNRSPHILHFATHGKYLSLLDNLDSLASLKFRLQIAGNPLQRSMLLLSNANAAWTTKEYILRSDNDGILTAYEVSHLDLSNTKLVVLSACNTGISDIHDTEGVIGLQHAFKLAGAQHVVVSLWKVNDIATKDLMILFYQNLLNKKQDTATALHNAKAEMRNKGAKPQDWAGFILIE